MMDRQEILGQAQRDCRRSARLLRIRNEHQAAEELDRAADRLQHYLDNDRAAEELAAFAARVED